MKVLNVGVGLGGCKFALALTTAFNTTEKGKTNSALQINMNIAKTELDCFSFGDKIHITSGEKCDNSGAGQDRVNALETFKKFDITKILQNIKALVEKESIEFIFVCYSVGGGTGSGIGPIINDLLFRFVEGTVDDCKVIGVPLFPTTDEGLETYRNTLLAIDDIQNNVIDRGGRIFGIVNNTTRVDRGSVAEKRKMINTASSSAIYEYLTRIDSHIDGVLDISDRKVGISNPGVHALILLNNHEQKYMNFMIGGVGSMCKSMLAIIPDNHPEIYETMAYEICRPTNSKIGYTPREGGIVGYHGMMNLKETTELYRKRFEDLKNVDTKGHVSTGVDSTTGIIDDIYHYNSRTSTIKDKEAPVSEDISSTNILDVLSNYNRFKV